MSVVRKDSVAVAAHSIGITNVSDAVTSALAPDVEYRIREIIQVRAGTTARWTCSFWHVVCFSNACWNESSSAATHTRLTVLNHTAYFC